MRFPAEDVGRIRRGEITATLRAFHGRPCAFKPADRWNSGQYVIEAVRDVRKVVASEGTPPLVLHFHPPKLVYERTVENTGDYIEVTARTRLPLNALTDASVAALGFDDLGTVVDVFCCDNGGDPAQSVWLIDFQLAGDMPRLLAWPNSSKHGHGDYVHSAHDILIAEPEAIDEESASHYSAQSRERRHESESARLARRIKEARKRSARTGVNVTLEVAVLQHELDEIERKLGRGEWAA